MAIQGLQVTPPQNKNPEELYRALFRLTEEFNRLIGANKLENSAITTNKINDLAVTSGKLAEASVTGTKLSTSAITLGYAEITSNFTTTTVGSEVDVTGLSVTVTVPAGGRRIVVQGFAPAMNTSATAATAVQLIIKEGATHLSDATFDQVVSSYRMGGVQALYTVAASAGVHTYKIAVYQGNAGTVTMTCGSSSPAFILVKAI